LYWDPAFHFAPVTRFLKISRADGGRTNGCFVLGAARALCQKAIAVSKAASVTHMDMVVVLKIRATDI
jgi:hypothetical protein